MPSFGDGKAELSCSLLGSESLLSNRSPTLTKLARLTYGDLRVNDLPPELQEYAEDYIASFVPRHRVVFHWFDMYDLEEQRL